MALSDLGQLLFVSNTTIHHSPNPLVFQQKTKTHRMYHVVASGQHHLTVCSWTMAKVRWCTDFFHGDFPLRKVPGGYPPGSHRFPNSNAPRRIGDAFVEGLDGNLVGVLPGHQHLRQRLFFMGKMGKSWGRCMGTCWESRENTGKICRRIICQS